jgi:uncharacterized protein
LADRAASRQLGALAPAGPPRLWVLSDGRVGHERQTLAIADALSWEPQLFQLRPRWLFSAPAPFFFPDPRDLARLRSPLPQIAFAAGRRTLPALGWLRRRGVFTIYVNKPATGARAAHVIVAPAHDALFAPNAVTPATPAVFVSPERLAARRASPDPRVAAVRAPRVAFLVGGDSRHFRFTPTDAAELSRVARSLSEQGYGVMATLSRRSPAPVRAALAEALAGRCAFLWDGAGANPYGDMLALADHIVVTADSVNMVAEAVATGAPTHVFAPSGGSAKIRAYLQRLQALGAVRPWAGRLESWRYEPINSTQTIAAAISRAWRIFQGLPA